MAENIAALPRFSPVGENALLVTFDDALSRTAHDGVRKLDESLAGAPLAGVTEWIPAYTSLLGLYV